MTRRGAAAGSLIFVVVQPGLMGGLVPYWLTGGWESAGSPLVLKLVGALQCEQRAGHQVQAARAQMALGDPQIALRARGHGMRAGETAT